MIETTDVKAKKNIYDWLLIIIIVLQVFGIIGDAYQPVKLFAVILIPFVLYLANSNRLIVKKYLFEIFFFTFWLCYGVLSLFWSIILESSLKEIVYLSINVFIFFEIVFFANKAVKPQQSIIIAWLALFLITFPIALYEFIYDIHLPMAVQGEGMMLNYGSIVLERKFASVTFGNLNGFNTMLMYIFPFIIGYLIKTTSKIQTAFLWLVIAGLSYIVILNGSRGGVLCLVIGFTVLIYYYLKGKKSFFYLLIIFLGVIYFAITNYDELFGLIIGRFDAQGFSDEGRSDILVNSLDAFINSAMFGVGAGNFMPTMNSVYHLELTAAHNFLLEIVIQYGLIIFLLFITMLIKMLINIKNDNEMSSKLIVISSLIMFPISSTIDSGYILGANVWIFLACILVISDKQLEKEYNNG
jgi:teichuronic acid biosynthesis protein TuaE